MKFDFDLKNRNQHLQSGPHAHSPSLLCLQSQLGPHLQIDFVSYLQSDPHLQSEPHFELWLESISFRKGDLF
jgi:hypothetical protein